LKKAPCILRNDFVRRLAFPGKLVLEGAMNNGKTGRWFLGYGGFLILCGLLGYLSNPAAAKTALISGGTFGLLSAAWGFWMLRGGGKPAWFAAAATTLLLLAAFTWRSVASWQAFFEGEPKLIAAVLISAMWVGTVASLAVLWNSRR
jgi:uncharacterized membrane protein (UPF0136 family)